MNKPCSVSSDFLSKAKLALLFLTRWYLKEIDWSLKVNISTLLKVVSVMKPMKNQTAMEVTKSEHLSLARNGYSLTLRLPIKILIYSQLGSRILCNELQEFYKETSASMKVSAHSAQSLVLIILRCLGSL